ncbi:protein phosphatase methylesterase 1 [Culex quinquefasciatus]|uniref:protein phosphatase methylesterase 1 n=1 Tax=Culex quinquefasciatus TaxID=7176 RepID=UPI0018E37769|nr:protein phosphatase methylesterase 1 [Culex quinquefasciatus]XP_039446468.1 protein phosphatase methylesterase 1 [Culex pipiens pallens]
MSNLQRVMMKSRLPPMCPNPKFPKPNDRGFRRTTDYNPVMWSEYFAEQRDVQTGKGVFRVYLTKQPEETGPLLVMLHGGGFSALSWAHFSVEIAKIIHCQCLAIDIRGHGDTQTDNEDDLSAETLAQDIGDILQTMYGESCPPVLLVGHSMGGAICVHVANMDVVPALIGAVVIDVVEGTALEALASMQSFLRSRPNTFKSIQHAIEWCVRSGQIRNIESARVSMPGQIVNIETGKLSTNELPLPEESTDEPTKFSNPNAIAEDAELPPPAVPTPVPSASAAAAASVKKYTWRIDLSKSEKYWEGWFQGLSQKFLDVRVPKLLLLAGIDNLDRALTVGQMQGKFQLQVLARCGHAVHEDRPHEVAEVIGTYLLRNKFAQPAGDGHFLKNMPMC